MPATKILICIILLIYLWQCTLVLCSLDCNLKTSALMLFIYCRSNCWYLQFDHFIICSWLIYCVPSMNFFTWIICWLFLCIKLIDSWISKYPSQAAYSDCSSSSRAANTLLWPLWLSILTCTYQLTDENTGINIYP